MATTGPSASQKDFEAASAAKGNPIPIASLAAWTQVDGTSGYEVPLLPSPESVLVFDKMRAGPLFLEGYEGVWSAFPVRRDFNETTHKATVQSTTTASRCGRAAPSSSTTLTAQTQRATRMRRRRSSGSGEASLCEQRVQRPLRCGCAWRFEDPSRSISPRVVFRRVTRATDSRTVRALSGSCPRSS